MNIDLILIGKTDQEPVRELVARYHKRINHYVKFNIVTLPDVRTSRSMTEAAQRKTEGEQILKNLSASDLVVLLDEKGEELRSVEFARWMVKRMAGGSKRMAFVVGGPYGFSPEVYDRADDRLSLSRMTFSHQIIRIIFTEQLYRAFAIIKGEPYHHE